MSRRRADQALPLLWEFPGGKVEPGEAPEQALAREVREELGCGVAVGRIHDVVFHAYPDYDVYLLVYPCTIVEGTPERRRGGRDRLGRARRAARARSPARGLSPGAAVGCRGYPLARRLAVELCAVPRRRGL